MNLKNLKSDNVKLISLISLVVLALVLILGSTYAYFIGTSTNTNTVTGKAGSIDFNVLVERIYPTSSYNNMKLVPLLDGALGNAISGSGGTSNCIDSIGNLSCEVYKITVNNFSDVDINVSGTLQLFPSSGSTFSDLKWRELSNPTTIKGGSTINNKNLTYLDQNLSIASSGSKIYYIAIWISENNTSQNAYDNGGFYGQVSFNAVNGKGVTGKFGNNVPNI